MMPTGLLHFATALFLISQSPGVPPVAISHAGVPPVAISHGSLLRFVLSLTRPVSAACQSPPCQRGVPRQRRGGGIPQSVSFPHGFVLSRSANCESLSHGCAVPAPFGKGAILRPVSLLCRRLGFIPPDRREVAWGAAPRRREPAGAKAIGRPEVVPPQVCQVFGFDHTKASCKIGTGNR